jgi:hypothetical protein
VSLAGELARAGGRFRAVINVSEQLTGELGDAVAPETGGDGATGAVEDSIATGPNRAVVAGAAGDVWVSIHEGGEVWRIRPS